MCEINKTNKCFYGLGEILRTKAISKNLKFRKYLTLILPIVLKFMELKRDP